MKRRGEHARREAEKTKARGMPWDHDVAAARWKEEIEEARSAAAGTHPKLAGLEDEELERRKEKFAAAPLGKLNYERQDGTFRFIMNQVDNLSTQRTRDIKIGQMTDLVNRYDAYAWGIGKHGINPQKRPASETMANYFDTEVDLQSVSSSNTAERSESNHLPGGTAIVATNTLCGLWLY